MSAVLEEPATNLFEVVLKTNGLQVLLTSIVAQTNSNTKMLTGLADEVRSVKHAVDGLRENMHEAIGALKRTVQTHDSHLKSAQLQNELVTTAQFTSTVNGIKEQLLGMNQSMQFVQKRTDSLTKEALDNTIDAHLHQFYNEIIVREAYVRHTRTLEQTQEELAREKGNIIDIVNKKLEAKSNIDYVHTLTDSLREDTIRLRRIIVEESERQSRGSRDNEKQLQQKVDELQGTLDSQLNTASARIAALYDVLSLSESETRRCCDARQSEEPQQRPRAPVAASAEPSIETDIDNKTALLMRSPAFLSFRHQILRDLADRLNTSRTSSASDLSVELLDLRNEVRQRTTTQRVIELIKQYSDAETPLKVSALSRRVHEIEQEKVGIGHFNEALRAKGDVLSLESKAERGQLTDLSESVKVQIFTIQQTIAELLAERSEFKEILRDVLYMHKRAAATTASPLLAKPPQSLAAATPLGNPSASQPTSDSRPAMSAVISRLPTDTEAAPAVGSSSPPLPALVVRPGGSGRPGASPVEYLSSPQGVDRRTLSRDGKRNDESLAPEPTTMGTREKKSTQRQQEIVPTRPNPGVPTQEGAPTATRRNVSVRPLTDHRQREREVQQIAAVTGTPTLPKLFPTAARPLPVSTMNPERNRVGGPTADDVVPMTASQEAYARVVAEAVLRREAAAAPPIPYQRDLKSRTVEAIPSPDLR